MWTAEAEKQALSRPVAYSVRRADRPLELSACRMLLPAVFDSAATPALFIAASEAPLRVLGSAALLPRAWGRNPPGFRFAVRVARPYRRLGIGSALTRAVADEARRQGAPALRPWDAVVEGPEAAFLRSIGFVVTRRLIHFEADVAGIAEHLRALRGRVALRGKVPEGVRVVPLREVPARQVVSLCRRHLGGMPRILRESIEGRGRAACSPDHSVILMVGDRIGGGLLFGWAGTIPRVEAHVVEARHRGRWANVLLMARATENWISAGATRFRFFCYDDNRDTLRLAERCGAEIQKVESFYALDLTGDRHP